MTDILTVTNYVVCGISDIYLSQCMNCVLVLYASYSIACDVS